MLLDFLANGESTLYPAWRPLEADPSSWTHLKMDADFTAESGLPFQQRMQFWRSLDVFWNATLPDRGTENKNKAKQEL